MKSKSCLKYEVGEQAGSTEIYKIMQFNKSIWPNELNKSKKAKNSKNRVGVGVL